VTTAHLLSFTLLGALLGLDVVSFPQAMMSRPIVAATAAGALAGHPMRGLLAGAILEMMAMETLPIGASRYPEWGTAAVVGGALFAVAPNAGSGATAGALVLSTLAALATAFVGGWSMFALRRLNQRWAARARGQLDRGSASTVVALQLRGLTADLLRAAAVTALTLLLFVPLVSVGLAHWSLDPKTGDIVVATLAATVAGSAAWKLAQGAPGAKWAFIAGAAAGLAAVWRQ